MACASGDSNLASAKHVSASAANRPNRRGGNGENDDG